jgi:hypothetical protein
MVWMTRILFLSGKRDFSPLHELQAGFEVHPVSYRMGKRVGT